jgi:hypothetical protein
VTRLLRRARPLAWALALLVGLTFVAPPAFAVETPAPLPAAAAQPLAAAAAAMVEALPAAAVAQATPAKPAAPATGAAKPAPAATEGKSFFKTPTGIVSLVLLGGALGAMAYSFSNGRVKSPAK